MHNCLIGLAAFKRLGHVMDQAGADGAPHWGLAASCSATSCAAACRTVWVRLPPCWENKPPPGLALLLLTLFCKSILLISISLLKDLMMTFSLFDLQVAICTTLMSPSYTSSI